jgi:hypothetical protein
MVQTLWDSITQSITGAPSADDIRRRREDESAFSSLYDAARQRDAELAAAGRRPVLGGLLSKEPVAGMDTLRYEGITPLILGLLSPVARAVDAPMAAYQGNIPMQDMAGEALGTAGMAALGGAALTRPAGSVGMGGRESDFGQGWQSAYHWTRSPEAFDQFDPDKSTSAMSQLGPHVGTKEAAEARAMGFPNETGQMMELRADTRRPFLNPRTNEPWSELDIEQFISAFADEHGVDRRDAAPIMRRMLANEGYTDIPYINDVEDAGSISNIMLVDRPGNVDAVLRRSNAAFDPARRTDPNLLAANRSTAGGLLASALPAPRNEAEAMARNILEMRAAGRAGDVTEEMRAAADPMYMYQNTPLPMDEASRMARAREMGRVDDQYHATLADFQAFRPSETGLVGRGVYSGDFPTDIEDYARKQGTSDGLNIIPLLAPSEQTYARRIDWQNLVDADEAFPWNATVDETIQGFKRAADTMSSQGYSGVNSQPGERATFDPASLRSRFALFDPEFRHLRNLSAGIGGLGLLATQMPEQQRDEEIRQYLGGLL